MNRLNLACGYRVALGALLLAVAAAGCTRQLVTTAAYLLKGTDAEADFKGLKGKKVAVVCRPLTNLTFNNPSVAAELARQVSNQLRSNVSKIKLIDQQKVAQWTDTHQWDEFPEVGKALEAEMVVGIELQDFSVHQGQTLYQGRASVQLTVYDCAQGNKVVYEQSLPRVLYPPNTGIPTSEMPEVAFRQKFLRVLADRVGRHFYAHDAHADLALDLDAL